MLDINLINQKLKEGKSVKQIAIDLEMGYSTLKKHLQNDGYKQVDRQYIIPDNNVAVRYADIVKDSPNLSGNADDPEPDTIADILLRLEKLENIIQNNTNATKQIIIINLPEADEHVTSFRLNDKVMEMWKEFLNKNQGYKSKDLVAQALLDFMEQHQ